MQAVALPLQGYRRIVDEGAHEVPERPASILVLFAGFLVFGTFG